MKAAVDYILPALFGMALSCFVSLSFAVSSELSPVGAWKVIDDKTGEAKSIITIWEEDTVLYGRISKILKLPKDGKPGYCKRCPGELKDAPILGLKIMWGLKKDGDVWNGGRILNPKNGKIYRVKMKTVENGNKLEVRGFIGLSLFGRTQTWLRVD